MNLRSSRSGDSGDSGDSGENKTKSDPKAPHLFQEIAPGNRGCALCSRGKSDPRHIEEVEEGGRWGF